jgi:S-DNA-T family DNA segregation ATPase FtsK/SpoIIIE
MEEIGVVGPVEGAKPRPLLITRQQWQEMQFINGTAPIADNLPEADDFSQADFYDNEDDN